MIGAIALSYPNWRACTSLLVCRSLCSLKVWRIFEVGSILQEYKQKYHAKEISIYSYFINGFNVFLGGLFGREGCPSSLYLCAFWSIGMLDSEARNSIGSPQEISGGRERESYGLLGRCK